MMRYLYFNRYTTKAIYRLLQLHNKLYLSKLYKLCDINIPSFYYEFMALKQAY